jgi:predicted TIM-barrel fold metal-dependent hydrolase
MESRADYGVIDAHTHINPFEMLNDGAEEVFRLQHGAAWEQVRETVKDPGAVLNAMDEAGIERIVLVNYVSPDVIGYTDDVNEWVIRYAAYAPDRFLPVGSINPRFVKDCGKEMRRLADLGVKAMKFHPAHQLAYPNAYRDDAELRHMSGMYEVAQELGLPFLFHTGTSIFPKARVKYADPICLDDVIVDFPDLTIVMAHAGRPFWVEQCLFLVRRGPNVYIDLSSIPPRKLLEFIPSAEAISDRLLYGSDWPGPGPKNLGSNIKGIAEAQLSENAKRLILRENALRVYWR